MPHFHADMIRRSHDEIEEMCKEMRDSVTNKSAQFEKLSYEQGAIAVIRWLYFDTGQHPCDITDRESGTVERTKKEIMEIERAQAREGSDA